MGLIPKGWKKYSTIGYIVEGTPFVPFKVPLKQGHDTTSAAISFGLYHLSRNPDVQDIFLQSELDQEEWFGPKDVMEKYPDMKLVINLTYTDTGRYYDFTEFRDNGVKVMPIRVQGGGLMPTNRQIKRFYDVVNDFRSKNRDSLIGVHCTHGVNRTGYFICKYMIECMYRTPEEAIDEFQSARGEKMDRPPLIADIKRTDFNAY